MVRFGKKSYSGAPAAEGRHAEPYTYRTHAFIFSWSSTAAAYGSRARTYKRRTRRKNGGLWQQSGAQPSPALYYYYQVNLEKNNPELRF